MYIDIKLYGKVIHNLELIRISCDKIKISLTKAELEEYALTVEEMDGAAPKTQRAFRELFVSAKDQTGFDTDGEKVFVQIFRAKGGGCEIFVSKVMKRQECAPQNDAAYYFSELDTLVWACRALVSMGVSSRSDAYSCDGGYILCLRSPSEIEMARVSEWAIRTSPPEPEYIGERYSLIKETDAVQTLSRL